MFLDGLCARLGLGDRVCEDRDQEDLDQVIESVKNGMEDVFDLPKYNSLYSVNDTDGVSFATGNLSLFFTAWSLDHIHGSDSLLPAIAFVDTILEENELVTGMSVVNWWKMIDTDLKIMVIDDDADNRDFGDTPIVMSFQVVTSKKRKLNIYTFDGDEYVGDYNRSNPYADLDRLDNDDEGNFVFKLPKIDFTQFTPALLISSLAEIITVGIVAMDIFPPGLMLEITNLEIPNEEVFKNENVLVLSPNVIKERVGKKFIIKTLEFKLFGIEGEVTVGVPMQ